MKRCFHEQFLVEAHVNKDREALDAPPHHYWMELKVRCAACGEPMTFEGLPEDRAIDRPCVDRSGKNARIPLRPSGSPRLLMPVGGVQRGLV